ncbi:hypothetical protein L2E82_14297 [Cichorium intybus]|uniref:Uncharacterized protein n=1 Tax=Cichorium intybus TaxID=13427 RepID=A0ACB9F018_CICIN|nr:hypothetical protein L2E82_14297 [Cichorium intybus]
MEPCSVGPCCCDIWSAHYKFGVGSCGLSEGLGCLVPRVSCYFRQTTRTISVLKKEFPKGVDIVYESVGGDMFGLCFNVLAIYGRMVVIGMISQYQGEDGWKPRNYTGLCEKILAKSQTLPKSFCKTFRNFTAVSPPFSTEPTSPPEEETGIVYQDEKFDWFSHWYVLMPVCDLRRPFIKSRGPAV